MAFLCIGENLNATRRSVKKALKAEDLGFVEQAVRVQLQGGAHLLDINAGHDPTMETKHLVWLARQVGTIGAHPVCIDSANPTIMKSAINAWIEAHGKNIPETGEWTLGIPSLMLNSISLETSVYEGVLPLLSEFNCSVVALCLRDKQTKPDQETRVQSGRKLLLRLQQDGVSLSRIYLDPLVMPIGVDSRQAMVALQVANILKQEFPGLKTVCGLSNASFGLPARRVVNRSFLSLLLQAKFDAAIMDCTDPQIVASLHSTQALLGQDEFCMSYIKAYRAQRFSN